MSGPPDRPIPVREIHSDAPAAGQGPAPPPPPADGEADPPLVRWVEAEGVRWSVSVVGRTRTGFGADAGAVLLELRYVAEAPEGGEGGEGGEGRTSPSPRGTLAPARSLDDLSDEELVEFLGRARPRP